MFKFVSEFLDTGTMPSRVNVMWVTLIPKIKSPICDEDYRPISMVGSLYTIVSKLLSIRLKYVLAPLIDKSQSAFDGETDS